MIIYVDFKSPASYLCLQPTLDVLKRHGVTAVWRPFQAIEREVPKLKAHEELGETHRRVRAEAQRQTHERYAALQGIALNFPRQPARTDLALGALGVLRDQPFPFIQDAFEAYWSRGDDLDDLETIKAMLENVGVEASDLSEHMLRNALQISQLEAEAHGVVDAPAYLIDDQIFIGRQHLPWIEELILQRK